MMLPIELSTTVVVAAVPIVSDTFLEAPLGHAPVYVAAYTVADAPPPLPTALGRVEFFLPLLAPYQ